MNLAQRDLVTAMATAAHSMCWLTWVASERPGAVTQARIDAYEGTIRF